MWLSSRDELSRRSNPGWLTPALISMSLSCRESALTWMLINLKKKKTICIQKNAALLPVCCAYSKSKWALFPSAVEMQITPETAFVQQQHHCSCLGELQTHYSCLMCISHELWFHSSFVIAARFRACFHLIWNSCDGNDFRRRSSYFYPYSLSN